MTRLRVLFVIDAAVDSGGAERFALGLATHLPNDRFKVWFCATRRADAAALSALDDAAVTHISLGRQAKWDLHRLAPLAQLARRERIHVLHAHQFGSNLWGTLIGRACRVPVVLAHEQTWSYEGDPVRRWLDGRVIGRLATRFIAVSSLDAERMVSIERVPADKVVMIPNAYVPRPRSEDTDVRAQLGISASTPVIAVVAVLRPQKALSVMVQAYAQVLESVPDARLVIAGHGPCLQELQEQVGGLGLDDQVRFLGLRHDVDSILRAADVAAMSSDYEGTPLVAYECIANRVPLVATAVGGLPDIVDHGRTGLLVPPRDPSALAAALVSLLTDPARRDAIARAAAGRLEEFSIEAAAERFATLYETLAAESGHRAQAPAGALHG